MFIDVAIGDGFILPGVCIGDKTIDVQKVIFWLNSSIIHNDERSSQRIIGRQ